MKTPALSVIALAAMTGFAIAADSPSEDITTKAMQNHPGTGETGMTDMPTKEPKTSDLTNKVQKDAPGTNGGMTDKPTKEPETDSLSDADENTAN
jgi:hypothetical protein